MLYPDISAKAIVNAVSLELQEYMRNNNLHTADVLMATGIKPYELSDLLTNVTETVTLVTLMRVTEYMGTNLSCHLNSKEATHV